MRWQDESPINELIAEGVALDGAYLSVARVGDDRKEAQIGTQPIDDANGARVWLDRTATGAVAGGTDARLRIRLWRADKTPVRGITTRVWPDPVEATTEEPLDSIDEEPPMRIALHRPAFVARAAARPTDRPSPVHPAQHVGCPTCASTSTTVTLLQSRVSELSAMLGTAQTAVRDARRDADGAKEAARSRSRRVRELEAENADLFNAIRRLRRENRELTEGAQAVLEAVNRFAE